MLHLANKTRIGCANFHLASDGETNSVPAKSEDCSTSTSVSYGFTLPSTLASSGYAIPTGSAPGYNATVPSPTVGKPTAPGSPSATSSPPAEFTGAASKVAGGAGALFAAGAAAAVFAL